MDIFALRLLVSFTIGGSWVTLITAATIRFGPRLGGILAGFPSTVAFSLVFIGWTISTSAAIEATTALPLALGFTASFPLVYAYLAKKVRFAFAILGALAFWTASSVVISNLAIDGYLSFWACLVAFYGIIITAYVVLAEKRGRGTTSIGVRPTSFQWTWRFLLAGGIIVTAIFLSETLGPLAAGVFTSFPAIITSTIYIVGTVEGVEASRSIAAPITVSTGFTIIPYLVVVRYGFPVVGVFAGTLVGYAVASALSVVAFYILASISR